MNTAKWLILAGCLFAALAVVAGAFGAHALKDKMAEDLMKVYQTGVQYHFYHALGLILIGLLALHFPAARALPWAGGIMALGIVLFSGSLYALSLSGIRVLGAITPIGGVAFIVAWAMTAIGVWKS